MYDSAVDENPFSGPEGDPLLADQTVGAAGRYGREFHLVVPVPVFPVIFIEAEIVQIILKGEPAVSVCL